MVLNYYTFLLEQSIVEYFEKATTKTLLPRQLEFWHNIEMKGTSCKNLGEAFEKYYSNPNDLFNRKLLCLKLEKGIGNDGLLGTITNYMSYLFDEYIDFALRKTPNLIYDIQFISTLRMMYLSLMSY